MAHNLVIVESPAKAKTIERFLGPDYTVMASFGHVRALPSKQGSVDIANDFEPRYQVLPESKKHIDAIRKALKGADSLLLATDPDREGERSPGTCWRLWGWTRNRRSRCSGWFFTRSPKMPSSMLSSTPAT